MELKFSAIIDEEVKAVEFKLYLYGIEINFQHLVWQSRTVQIVPLWNWNSIDVSATNEAIEF